MRNRSENQITLVLIRHGATKANKEHRYLGQTEEELSQEGKKELAEYKNNHKYPLVDFLFTSPMKRCIQTAEILYPHLKPVEIAEWTEMDFGAFEGKNYEDLKDDKDYQAWIDSGGTLPFPGGESREEFILRCEKGFQKLRKELRELKELHTAEELNKVKMHGREEMPGNEEKKRKTVGMVVHGGTIMALLSRYCGGDYFDYQVPNGEGYICAVKEENGTVEFLELTKL